MIKTKDIELLADKYAELSVLYCTQLNELSEKALNMTPRYGGWTAAQVVSHITQANDSRFLIAPGKNEDRDISLKIPGLKQTFLNFEIKMESPEFLIPENKLYSKQECIDAIRNGFKSLIENLLKSDLSQIIESPLGVLTKWEMANFVAFHSERHLYQLMNISKTLKKHEN